MRVTTTKKVRLVEEASVILSLKKSPRVPKVRRVWNDDWLSRFWRFRCGSLGQGHFNIDGIRDRRDRFLFSLFSQLQCVQVGDDNFETPEQCPVQKRNSQRLDETFLFRIKFLPTQIEFCFIQEPLEDWVGIGGLIRTANNGHVGDGPYNLLGLGGFFFHRGVVSFPSVWFPDGHSSARHGR